MKIKRFIIVLSILAIGLVSCEDDGYEDFDNGQTNTQAINGEFYVATYDASGTPVENYHLWSTYNTAANNDSIWLDGSEASAFAFKSRILGNPQDLSFAAQKVASSLDDITVTITGGKIIKDGGKSAVNRTVVDSIYFQAEFSDEPGVIYTFGGHGKTGFLEDGDPSL